ncbi:rRNA-processing protein cgr1 [Steccherinum ochraceum]|uniref:rRNA-processing protein n=1 Tax=Steccherinum ochraceum TaxID=92696 RepID=A0A4R0RRY4_9APHY|nr:rRNA-processing protein cgr1 [Steccherinum ochraceum]
MTDITALASTSTSTEESAPVSLSSSSSGRVSGKPWKYQKTAAVRSNLPDGVKSSFSARMQKTQKEQAIKQLQTEMKEEKLAEIKRRRDITQERKRIAEEKRRLEEDKAKMGARKAARMRRKAGRTKKINQ